MADVLTRLTDVEKVNARLEGAALTTARALAEISGHWEAVYEAMRYCESKPVEVAYDQRVSDLLADATGANDPDYATNVEKHRRVLGPEVHRRIEEQAARELGLR